MRRGGQRGEEGSELRIGNWCSLDECPSMFSVTSYFVGQSYKIRRSHFTKAVS